MAKIQLTETQCLAKCLARALANEPKTYGAEQGKVASDALVAMFKADSIDGETFSRVNTRLGNHSAIRQWAVAHGFIGKDADALAINVSEEIAAEKERLTDLAK